MFCPPHVKQAGGVTEFYASVKNLSLILTLTHVKEEIGGLKFKANITQDQHIYKDKDKGLIIKMVCSYEQFFVKHNNA